MSGALMYDRKNKKAGRKDQAEELTFYSIKNKKE